jgi:hypothetical protein
MCLKIKQANVIPNPPAGGEESRSRLYGRDPSLRPVATGLRSG